MKNYTIKKIHSGYYELTYKGWVIEIHKVEQVDSNTKNKWYWLVGNDGGHDHFNGKATAILAAIEAVEEGIIVPLEKQ